MPLFFLHLRADGAVFEDREGGDWPSLAAAHDAALRSARSMLAEELLRGELADTWQIEISGPGGETLEVVPFTAAFTARSKHGP